MNLITQWIVSLYISIHYTDILDLENYPQNVLNVSELKLKIIKAAYKKQKKI